MRKLILMGRSEAGKSTLIQAMRRETIRYVKTQYIDNSEEIIDTPGEYTEDRRLGSAIAIFSAESDVIGFVISAIEPYSLFSPAAAAHFCQKCNREILLLDTRDPTSWFNHLKSKPSNVIHWRNVLPSEPFLRTPESRHMDTFYFCGFNMANVFRWLGGPWGLRDGAVNLMPSACDHHDVGEAID